MHSRKISFDTRHKMWIGITNIYSQTQKYMKRVNAHKYNSILLLSTGYLKLISITSILVLDDKTILLFVNGYYST